MEIYEMRLAKEGLKPITKAPGKLRKKDSEYRWEVDGKLVSSCEVWNYRDENIAFIVAVRTRERYKNKGYATTMLQVLCKRLIKEGKEPRLTLYCTNETALHVYEKVGFTLVPRVYRCKKSTSQKSKNLKKVSLREAKKDRKLWNDLFYGDVFALKSEGIEDGPRVLAKKSKRDQVILELKYNRASLPAIKELISSATAYLNSCGKTVIYEKEGWTYDTLEPVFLELGYKKKSYIGNY